MAWTFRQYQTLSEVGFHPKAYRTTRSWMRRNCGLWVGGLGVGRGAGCGGCLAKMGPGFLESCRLRVGGLTKSVRFEPPLPHPRTRRNPGQRACGSQRMLVIAT